MREREREKKGERRKSFTPKSNNSRDKARGEGGEKFLLPSYSW